MTDSLVKRLRAMDDAYDRPPTILAEAADEIERLERRLAEAREIADGSFDLLAKDKRWGRIKKLEELNAALMQCCQEYVQAHSDPESPNYNECEKDKCQWCTDVAKVEELLDD